MDQKVKIIIFSLFFLMSVFGFNTYAAVRTQFVPSASITEEYTDNYNRTENNEDDEYTTIYALGISFGIIGRTADMFLNYNPEYTDYLEYDVNDSWSHEVSLEGEWRTSEHTILSLSEVFVKDLTRTVRTNAWEKHETNTTTAGISHEFGDRKEIAAGYTYAFDSYDDPSADEYKSHHPEASLLYWFTPQFGMELEGYYEKVQYDISTDEPETWHGEARFLKSMTRHLDTYISYAHSYTDQDSGDHTIYHPSIGFDWLPTEDSGVSIGLGVLFHEWEAPGTEDTEEFFADIDVFKNFNFSRRCTLSITGASGYEATDGEASSMGFHTYYNAGLLLTYALTRRLTAELDSTYEIDQYEEPPAADRRDTTKTVGAGLVWAPLRWLSISLALSLTGFDTDTTDREDYTENTGTLTITMTPFQPLRMEGTDERRVLEDRLFD